MDGQHDTQNMGPVTAAPNVADIVPEPEKKGVSLGVVVVSIVSVVVFAVAAFFLFLGFFGEPVVDEYGSVDTAPKLARADLPDGALLLTLFDERGGFYPTIYDMPIPDGTAPFPTMTTRQTEVYTEHVDYDLNYSAFSAIPNEILDTETENGLSQQIFIKSTPHDLQQITESASYWKMNPEWSPSGELIAFMATKEGKADMPDIGDSEGWSVFITDLEGNEQEITNGAYPQWSPDGTKLMVIKSAGLALVDLESGTEELIFIAESPLGWDSKLDVSKDGNYLAFARAADGVVDLLLIESWDPFSADLWSVFSGVAYWVVFSPDARYLAMHLPYENDGKRSSRIMVYDLDTKAELDLLDLSDYRQDMIFMTDWVYYTD